MQYTTTAAHVGFLSFQNWNDEKAASENMLRVAGIKPYQPGAFYRRELPPILKALKTFGSHPHTIVIDGYVWLSQTRKGLGQHLYEALEGKIAVIGVAKTTFANNDAAVEVHRGKSRTPLFVTAAGIAPTLAASIIASMHGPYRLPTLLKRTDQLARLSAQMPD